MKKSGKKNINKKQAAIAAAGVLGISGLLYSLKRKNAKKNDIPNHIKTQLPRKFPLLTISGKTEDDFYDIKKRQALSYFTQDGPVEFKLINDSKEEIFKDGLMVISRVSEIPHLTSTEVADQLEEMVISEDLPQIVLIQPQKFPEHNTLGNIQKEASKNNVLSKEQTTKMIKLADDLFEHLDEVHEKISKAVAQTGQINIKFYQQINDIVRKDAKIYFGSSFDLDKLNMEKNAAIELYNDFSSKLYILQGLVAEYLVLVAKLVELSSNISEENPQEFSAILNRQINPHAIVKTPTNALLNNEEIIINPQFYTEIWIKKQTINILSKRNKTASIGYILNIFGFIEKDLLLYKMFELAPLELPEYNDGFDIENLIDGLRYRTLPFDPDEVEKYMPLLKKLCEYFGIKNCGY